MRINAMAIPSLLIIFPVTVTAGDDDKGFAAYIAGDAAYNAMRAVQFQNIVIMRHKNINNDSLANKKS